MADDFLNKLARRIGESVGRSKGEFRRAQKRQKLEEIAKDLGITDVEEKTDDELIDEIRDAHTKT
ncbi:MAG: hypothetical protein ACLFVX_10525 [Archaeoglobaceae archaeon]